jgi:hypothetical protein
LRWLKLRLKLQRWQRRFRGSLPQPGGLLFLGELLAHRA